MRPIEEINRAAGIARQYHAEQLDKAGLPYVGHLERVASMVGQAGGTWAQEAAAWLHDVVEDTALTVEEMAALGVPETVTKIVAIMTHVKEKTNVEYWDAIRAEPAAVLVKLCDIYDNLSPARMRCLDEATRKRLLLKYSKAIQVIVGAVTV